MDFKELSLIISFSVSLIFAIVSFGLTIIAMKSDLIQGPLVLTFLVLLFVFIILSPIPVFVTRHDLNLPLPAFLAILALLIIIVGSLLILQSLQALKISGHGQPKNRSKMEDVVHIETKEYKITIGAGAIGLAGAILYGIAKIIEATKAGSKIQILSDE